MKKNVGSQLIAVQLVSSTDGSNVTGGTTTVAVELDGAAGTGGTATHIANGKWEYAPIQGDTNADHVTFQFTNSSAVSVLLNVYTIFPQTVDNNALAAGATGFTAIDTVVDAIKTITDALPDSGALTSLATATAVADVPTVAEFNARTLVAASYSTFDETSDTVANVGTVGTLTGHTDQTGDTFALANGGAGFVAIDTVVDAIKVVTDAIGETGTGLSAIPWNAAWDAEIESEVNDALDTAIAELGVAAPTATPTIRTGLMLLYMALRNKTVVQTSGTDALEIYNNAGTKIAAKLLTDDGSDYTEAEMG